MRTLSALVLAALAAATAAAEADGYRLLKTIPVPGDGGWDYLAVDEAARRVYVSHGTQVEVLDADSGEVKGKVPDTPGVHGIALAPGLGRGFTSNGRANTVTIFDLKTLEKLGEVKTGRNPDSILYDPATRQVFAFNGGSASATVIDAAKGTVAGTIEVGGRPEFAVSDGAGLVFVNIEDKDELLKIDARERKVLERWPLAPGKTPASLALDGRNRRLFVGCRNKLLAVVNADSGKVITTVPVGEGVDATAYDAEAGLVFSACGDGTVTVVRQDGPDKYRVMETVKARPGSKTLALDAKTHRLFIPAAKYKPGATPKARPTMEPGSFVVLIYGK
jgi:DNA-binding beta-propeller fold protein YncE